MYELPPVLNRADVIERMLIQHRNDLTKMEIEEQYLRRLSLKSEKMMHPLGQLQDQVKEKKAFIKFLEEIKED